MHYFVSDGAVVDWTLLPEPAGVVYVDAPLLPEGSWAVFGPDQRSFVWGAPHVAAPSSYVDAPLLPEGSWSIFGPDQRSFVWGVSRTAAYAGPVLFNPSVVIISTTSIRPRVSINWP